VSSPDSTSTTLAIIGAGASGCFAAANIPYNQGREVIVFEKTTKVLQKVKVSGGGRCNTTHHLFDIPELITRYPRGKQLLKKTLYRFSPKDTIEWFDARGVKLKAEADGRMFPVTDDSQTIIDCLWAEMMRNKVKVQYHKSLERIEKKDERFLLHFADKTSFTADKVLITCGGFPKDEQYHWMKSLGHTVASPVPSLFTFNIPKHPITELMGVALPEVTIKVAGTKITERGPILITHWGLSGPVVLRASAWGAKELNERRYDFNVQVNWLNDITEQDLKETITYLRREQGKQFIYHKNPFSLPRRLWEFLVTQSDVKEDTRWGDLPAAAQNKLIEHLIRHTFHVTGKTTFKEEFVTSGGISLSEVDPQTMESRIVKGLYFAGEVLNVDGITGGFNFQHAWSSGFIAAKSMVG
jgi:predicted Rossmann fold flavoprotein